MRMTSIAAIMVHVGDVVAAHAWYRRAFPQAVPRCDAAMAFDYLDIDGVPVEFVPSDAKVASGACGSVVYWRVQHLETALAHFESVGATRYRGSMSIDGGRAMCQVRDPWGNCIGLRGSAD